MAYLLKRLFLALPVLCLAAGAPAFDRIIPADARKAEFAITHYPAVLVNGKPRRLSPAAQIRNTDNLIVMPGVLGETRFAVRYTEDPQGDIDRVWILSPDEARQAAQR